MKKSFSGLKFIGLLKRVLATFAVVGGLCSITTGS